MKPKDILKKLGYEIIDRQKETSLWEQLFKGHLDNFHEYSEYQGASVGYVTRYRKSMKMAKVVSELWADNIINPETQFSIDNSDWLDEYFEDNNVISSLNDLMEITMSLGTGFTTQTKDQKGKAINQYVTINNAEILRVEYNEIKDVAFVSVDNDITYIQIHEEIENGYKITNLLFDDKGNQIHDDTLETEFVSPIRLFQVYKPAIVNNINLGSPLGISIYANAIDELKSVDIAYTALDQEIRNGRMRVYIQGEALHFDSGEEKPIFDSNQDEFYLLPEDAKNPDGTLITVQAPTLRVEQLITNLEKQLNLLGSKVGLGDNAFYSQDGTIYTNTTQVVSTNSKFYKTRQKHITRIKNSLQEMVKALYFLEFGTELNEVTIDFDDSIIHDKEAEQELARLEFLNGLISEVEYFRITRNFTEKEAQEYWNKQLKQKDLKQNVEEEGGEL